MYLQHTHMCPDSLYMWLHCYMDLTCTHQPSPHSSCLCILAGTDTGVSCPHLYTAQHSYTLSPPLHLQWLVRGSLSTNVRWTFFGDVFRNVQNVTFWGSIGLAGHTGNIAVKSCPIQRTVTGPGCCCLRADTPIMAAHLAAKVYNGLRVGKGKRKNIRKILEK